MAARKLLKLVLLGAGALCVVAMAASGLPAAQKTVACPVCQWAAPTTRYTVNVRSVDDLRRAAADARPSTTILLADGEYRLPSMLDLPVPDVVLRGRSGDRSKVVIRGDGMTEQAVGVALSISAPRITVADLTVGFVAYHGIQVRGESGASNFMLHNVRVVDTGQQLVKVTVSQTRAADDGTIACSLMEYTDHAPSSYTDGVDALGTKGWTVRDNRFVRIRGPQDSNYAAGPAVLFWANSIDTLIERNIVVDSFRGIALGLMPEAQALSRAGDKRFDHHGGVVRNNVICNLNRWGDEGIEANGARDVRIDHNTVMVEGSLGWSISTRFRTSTATIRNNITNRTIILRDGGQANMQGNLARAQQSWFQSPATCDLRPTSEAPLTADTIVPLDDVIDDFGRAPRNKVMPSAGAFERRDPKR